MKSLADTLRILEDSGLRYLFDEDSTLLEPAIELRTRPAVGDLSPIGSMKLGGLPDVPMDFVWPVDGKWPLTFIAQLDLASLHSRLPEVAAPLPATGVLSFFFNSSKQPWGSDLDDRTSWAVFHFQQTELHRPTQSPAGAVVFSVKDLSPEPTWTVRPTSYFTSTDMDFLLPYQEMFCQLHENTPDDLQLFGYPFVIQSDMRGMCQSGLDHVGSDDGCYELWRPGFEDWLLLLQVGSNGEMSWGDSGCIYFWIRRQDLARHRWDRIWVMLQCF
jgi:uncharacterized protein YwqG